jgi:hypothetical protein
VQKIVRNFPRSTTIGAEAILSFKYDHIEEDALESYSRQVLAEESAALVEIHLLVCEICRQRLVEVEAYTMAMQSAASSLRSEQHARARNRWSVFPRLIPAFAAFALLAIMAVTLPLVRTSKPAPFPVNLQTMRGTENLATAPSRRPLQLDLDLTGLAASPVYHIDLVDQTGGFAWKGTFSGEGATASVNIPAQKRGTYFVRLALPSGETIREYSLQIRGGD